MKPKVKVVVKPLYGLFRRNIIKQSFELDDAFVEYLGTIAESRRQDVLQSKVMEWFFKNHKMIIVYNSSDLE